MKNTINTLKEIDAIEVVVLMDNVSDPFTESHEGMRWNEFQYQFDVKQRREFCGADMCRACTGLSLLITVHADKQKYVILFDTGPDDGLVVENSKRLDVNLGEIDAIVISHGHFDHYSGLISVLKAINKDAVPVYIHPELLAPRAFQLDNGERVYDSYILTSAEIEAHRGKIIADKNPLFLLNDMALISGEVPRTSSYEKGFPNELRLINGQWEAAPLVIDERILIFKLKNKGLCVITGCGHTGVVNASRHAMQLTACNDIHLLMGGFHLAGASFKDRIDATVADLSNINPDYIVTGHCTGVAAQTALQSQFGDRHIPYGVATVFKFTGSNTSACNNILEVFDI